jgi:cytochrome c peroxidase
MPAGALALILASTYLLSAVWQESDPVAFGKGQPAAEVRLPAPSQTAASLPGDVLPALLPLDTIPLGLASQRPVPPDNSLTQTKVRLGRKLFFDPILSGDGRIACASCHQPAHGLAGPARLAVGIGGRIGKRNVPSLVNRAYGKSFFWDGRAASLEEQALHPIASPLEMGSSVARAVERLRQQAEYPALFRAAFGKEPNGPDLARALASFERVLLAGNSRVDRFRAGEVQAFDESERHGLWLYESRGRCWRCHSGPNFTDEAFHNTGISWGREPADLGRYEVTHNETDRGRFKTPSLRGLTATAPYMHDGSLATLEEVVQFYNRGGNKNPHLDPSMEPLDLSPADIRDLVAFLRALSDTAPGPGTH